MEGKNIQKVTVVDNTGEINEYAGTAAIAMVINSEDGKAGLTGKIVGDFNELTIAVVYKALLQEFGEEFKEVQAKFMLNEILRKKYCSDELDSEAAEDDEAPQSEVE